MELYFPKYNETDEKEVLKGKDYQITFTKVKDVPSEKIVGYISNKRYLSKLEPISNLKYKNHTGEKINFPIYKNKPRFHHVIGYQLCEDENGETSYAAICKRFPIEITAISVSAVVVIILAALFLHGKTPSDIIYPYTVSEEKINPDKEQGPMIDVNGFNNVTIRKNAKYLFLDNPENNHVYFVYTVEDENGNEVYKSDYIEPGENSGVNWEIRKDLDVGTYELTFHVHTYDINTMETRVGTSFKATVVIE